MQFKFISIILISLLITACYKTPDYPDTPSIAFDSFTVTQPYTVGTRGYLRLSFTDGGGDFGKDGNTTLDTSCYVKNTIDTSILALVLPNIPNYGTSDDISGFIDIQLPSILDELGCANLGGGPLYKSPFDTTQFIIYVKDRSGHISNTVVTPKFVFKCP